MTMKPTASARYKLDELSLAWSKAGGRLGRTDAGACVVRSCRSMAFVGLKTEHGARAVCLKHFESLHE